MGREAIADGYDSRAVTSVPAADVEGATLDHVQKLLAAPELVAPSWAATKRESDNGITEREVMVLLASLAEREQLGLDLPAALDRQGGQAAASSSA